MWGHGSGRLWRAERFQSGSCGGRKRTNSFPFRDQLLRHWDSGPAISGLLLAGLRVLHFLTWCGNVMCVDISLGGRGCQVRGSGR